jgi:dephospho-CoA kinase
MFIIGVGGLISSGKTYASKKIFNALPESEVFLFDADKEVAELYNKSKQLKDFILLNYPEFINQDVIDKVAISNRAFVDDDLLESLESIIHPLLREQIDNIIKNSAQKYLILDIALLYAGNLHKLCDLKLYIEAEEDLLLKRYLERENSSKEKFLRIINRQKLLENKKFVDVVINTSDEDGALVVINKIIDDLKNA